MSAKKIFILFFCLGAMALILGHQAFQSFDSSESKWTPAFSQSDLRLSLTRRRTTVVQSNKSQESLRHNEQVRKQNLFVKQVKDRKNSEKRNRATSDTGETSIQRKARIKKGLKKQKTSQKDKKNKSAKDAKKDKKKEDIAKKEKEKTKETLNKKIEEKIDLAKTVVDSEIVPEEVITVGGARTPTESKRAPVDQEDYKKEPENSIEFLKWKSKVVQKPSAEVTEELIQAYEKGEVSGQTFYRVVDLLLKSDQEEVIKLGVSALEKTPSSNSFFALYKYADQNETKKDEVQNSIKEMYSAPDRIHDLVAVLKADTSKYALSAYVLAASIVRDSAQSYLENLDKEGDRLLAYAEALQVMQDLYKEFEGQAFADHLLVVIQNVQSLIADITEDTPVAS